MHCVEAMRMERECSTHTPGGGNTQGTQAGSERDDHPGAARGCAGGRAARAHTHVKVGERLWRRQQGVEVPPLPVHAPQRVPVLLRGVGVWGPSVGRGLWCPTWHRHAGQGRHAALHQLELRASSWMQRGGCCVRTPRRRSSWSVKALGPRTARPPAGHSAGGPFSAFRHAPRRAARTCRLHMKAVCSTGSNPASSRIAWLLKGMMASCHSSSALASTCSARVAAWSEEASVCQ